MAGSLNILCFSSTDWDGVWGSRQQVMLRLAARGHHVLFVEQPAGLEHLARYPELRQRKTRRWREGVKEIAPHLWIYSLPPLAPGRYFSPAINEANQSFTASRVKGVLKQLGFEPDVVWVYQPEMAPLLGRFGEKVSVYHCIDEHAATAQGHKRRTVAQMDEQLARGADIVFANSTAIFDNKRPLNPRTYRVPSGADVDHFARALQDDTVPAPAIDALPEPRVGYIGNINERLDYDVLERVASAHPEWSLVLVGDTYPWTLNAPDLRRLDGLANVHFLGKQPFDDMPSFVKGMAVCVLPYVRDERASYRSPLKLYEYLAAGRPVVSTPHPEVEASGHAVYVAETPDGFVSKVVEAMDADDSEKQRQRSQSARPHSWDHRVDDMERRIFDLLDG